MSKEEGQKDDVSSLGGKLEETDGAEESDRETHLQFTYKRLYPLRNRKQIKCSFTITLVSLFKMSKPVELNQSNEF